MPGNSIIVFQAVSVYFL